MQIRQSIWIFIMLLVACVREPEVRINIDVPTDTVVFRPTPYVFQYPTGWPPMLSLAENPLTEEGVALGRKLFYDGILSSDSSISCASCHKQELAFTDNSPLSVGVNGRLSLRNSMPLFNLGWVENFGPVINGRPLRFFWDGGATSIEAQALAPITNPLEMNETLPNVLRKLNHHPSYPSLFKIAFGSDSITTAMLVKALAQFQRSLISANSKYQQFWEQRENLNLLTPQERRGYEIFTTEKGDCFHCHSVSRHVTDFSFRHNGHRSADEGLYLITGNAEDKGKFRVPSLLNAVFTAPYMHDGRFETLEQVVEFYNSGVVRQHPTDAQLLKHPNGLQLTNQEKDDLVAFLKTMTDSTFITNPKFSKPN